MWRREKKGVALPGSKREARLQDEARARARYIARLGQKRRRKPFNPVGLKRALCPHTKGEPIFTPYYAKERARRRAARRVAHESRRRNRA